MDQSANVALVRELLTIRSEGKIPVLEKYYDQNILWNVPGRKGIAGEFRGIEAVRAHVAKIRKVAGDTLRIEIRDLSASGDHVFALLHSTASCGVHKHDGDECLVYTIRGGKIVEIRSFVFDVHGNDEFWSLRDQQQEGSYTQS